MDDGDDHVDDDYGDDDGDDVGFHDGNDDHHNEKATPATLLSIFGCISNFHK